MPQRTQHACLQHLWTPLLPMTRQILKCCAENFFPLKGHCRGKQLDTLMQSNYGDTFKTGCAYNHAPWAVASLQICLCAHRKIGSEAMPKHLRCCWRLPARGGLVLDAFNFKGSYEHLTFCAIKSATEVLMTCRQESGSLGLLVCVLSYRVASGAAECCSLAAAIAPTVVTMPVESGHCLAVESYFNPATTNGFASFWPSWRSI